MVKTNPLIYKYKTLQFDQYSRLTIIHFQKMFQKFSFFVLKFKNEFEIWKKLSISLQWLLGQIHWCITLKI